MPSKQFTLLDANGKKIRFLTQIKHDLQLDNVSLELARAEQFRPKNCYDRVISRAFASLPNMLHYAVHLVCPTGQFIAMKGQYPKAEIRHLTSQFTLLNSQLLQVPGVEAKRHLVFIGLKEARLPKSFD
jgi:16S rRNA (guanine527-N7)-methyltransferase